MDDPVCYTVHVKHWQCGDVDVRVEGAGSSDEDRESIAYAFRKAMDLIEHGNIAVRQ